MNKFIDKFYNIIDKVGKRNLMLFFFVLIVVIIARLYNTFSLNTEVNESYINGIKTYEFVLNNNDNSNSVIIGAESQKYISIKVSNPDNVKLNYGLYYSSDDILTDVYVGVIKNSNRPGKGLIDGKENYVIDINILNLSDNSVSINFGLLYGIENGGELELPDGKRWLEEYSGPTLLSDMKIGSYVYYEGNNGCNKSSCMGVNANYSDDNKGYCYKGTSSYNSDGWRIAYVRKGTVYLVSAGAVDCVSSDVDGNFAMEELNNYDNSIDLSKHISNLNKRALTYCNRRYAYGNSCNNRSGWAFDLSDFKYITNQVLSSDKCFNKRESKECGFENSLIDVGSYYWIANANSANINKAFYWDGTDKLVSNSTSNHPLGVRPVLRLKDTVYVVSGSGTEKEPYLIDTFSEEQYDYEEISSSSKTVKLVDYIENEYKNGKEINSIKIYDDGEEVKESKESNIMLDNNNIYRYYGENPNNYVMFNDELWRIVSMSNVKSNKNDFSGKKRVKLVRVNSIGEYPYDLDNVDDGVFNWSKSLLMKLLNDGYYNQNNNSCSLVDNNREIDCDFSIIGFDSNARYLIDDAVYYLAKSGAEIDNLYASDYWNNERTGNSWVGKVGLIYGSDYMYAADLNVCKAKSGEYQNNKNCNSNWLYKVHNNTISNLENIKISSVRQIYPSVYLKDNVVISDGNGTENNPFILQIIN